MSARLMSAGDYCEAQMDWKVDFLAESVAETLRAVERREHQLFRRVSVHA